MFGQVYNVTQGSTDTGRDNEYVFTATVILELVLDDNINDFKLSSNNQEFHPFDDVVIEIETANDKQKHFKIQLKYRNDKSDLKVAYLTNTGDVNINKYFKDLKKQQNSTNLDNFSSILFINRKFVCETDTFKLKEEGIDVKILECEPEPLFRSCFKNIRSCKFEPVKSLGNYEYFNNFFLYTNQPNVEEMRKELCHRFQEAFNCEKKIFLDFLIFFNEWNKITGKREKLTKKWIKQLIAVHLLSPLVQPIDLTSSNSEKLNIFRQTIDNFDITIFEKNDFWDQISCFCTVGEKCEDVDEATTEKIKNNYQLEKFEGKENSMLMWLLKKCPLVIKYKTGVEKALNLCDKREHKFIILCDKLLNESVENIRKDFSVFKTLADLDENSESYKTIVQKFCCSLQGKPEITLKELIGTCKQVKECITTNHLLSSVNNQLVFSKEKSNSNLYFERFVSRYLIECKLLEKLLITEFENTIAIITNINEIKNDFQTLEKINVETVLKNSAESVNVCKNTIIYVTEEEFSQEDFDKICKNYGTKYSYHQFKMLGNQLEWVRSRGIIQHLKRFLDEEYISEYKMYEQGLFCKTEIFCGGPGIGKSTLIKNFKKNTFHSFWTILISPKDHRNHFDDKKDNIDAFKQYILHKIRSTLTDFEFKLFQILLNSQRVNFIWDGLDETPEKHLEIVLNVIYKLSSEDFKQCVTSRNNLKTKLEERFAVISKNIKEFNEEEQKKYIRKRIKCEEDELNEIFTKIRNNIEFFKYNEVLSIPLQIYMFTELLQDKEMYELLFNNLFSLSDLYERFIDAKFKVYFIKNNCDPANEISENYKENQIQKYELAALVTHFPDIFTAEINEKNTLKKFLDKIKNNQDPVGIIIAVCDGVPNFVHNSFGEYFAASYFSREYKNISNLSAYFFEEKHRNIRFLFDSILAKGYPAHIATLHKNVSALRNCKNDSLTSRDHGGRNPLHLACSWGNKYPLLDVENITANESTGYSCQRKIMDGHVHIIRQENQDQCHILKYLSEYCDPTEKDNVHNFDAYSYADIVFGFFVLGTVHEKHTIQLNNLKNYTEVTNILYYSAVFDFVEMFTDFEKIPLIITENDSCLLNVAAENDSIKVCRYLLNKSENKINSTNKYGDTPLHRASSKGHVDVVKLLIEHKADINFFNTYGETPLHKACSKGHIDVIQLLIDHNANVQVADKQGSTPLHFACFNGHTDAVELLIKSGANINARSRTKEVPLHIACSEGLIEAVRLLINKGADINASNLYEYRPLHYACAKGYIKAVELLLSHGADVNVRNLTDEVPLHIACSKGIVDAVELLINAGADVNAANRRKDVPLHVACSSGHINVIRMLLSQNAYVNATNITDEVPLHVACSEGFSDAVELLISHGADVNAVDTNGENCLRKAHLNGHDNIVRLLKGVGVDNMVNKIIQ